MKNHLVVALAYDQLCTFEFGCTVELFALQRPELEVDWYQFAVCAAEKGKIRAAGGITIEAPYSLSHRQGRYHYHSRMAKSRRITCTGTT